MAGYNRTVLMGNITANPELRYTPSGTAVADIRLAVNTTRGSGDKKQEEALFIDCTAWARTAEVMCEYLNKGDPVLVEGRLQQDSWEDKETGAKRSKIKMTIDNFTFVNKLSERGGNAPQQQKQPRQEEDFGDF